MEVGDRAAVLGAQPLVHDERLRPRGEVEECDISGIDARRRSPGEVFARRVSEHVVNDGSDGSRAWIFSTKKFARRQRFGANSHSVFSSPALADTDGRFTFLNKVFRRTVGLSPQERPAWPGVVGVSAQPVGGRNPEEQG